MTVRPLTSLPDRDSLNIVYDGACPFCANFVSMLHLQKNVGKVRLVDARDRPDVVEEMRARDLLIDRGMLVQHHNEVFWGADAVWVLSVLSSGDGFFNRILRMAFRNRSLVRLVYPTMRTGRAVTLRLLGRKLIA